MRCDDIREKFADALAGELEPRSRAEFDAHLGQCPACGEEFGRLAETWTRLGVLPQERPSDRVRSRFYAMLEGEQRRSDREPKLSPGRESRSRFGRTWAGRPAFQMAAALGLLVLGIFAGSRWGFFGRGGSASAAEVRGELRDMRRMLAVSLLKQDSPFDRLQGVSLSRDVAVDDRIIHQTLLRLLDEDPNVNVRLAAVDALYLFSDQPGVKDHILRSLSKQDSPLIQAALIDLVVGIREKRAVEALKALSLDKKLNPRVKEKAVQGIRQLSL